MSVDVHNQIRSELRIWVLTLHTRGLISCGIEEKTDPDGIEIVTLIESFLNELSQGSGGHRSDTCEGCQKSVSKVRRWNRFKSAPKVLVVAINRSSYKRPSGKLTQWVKVNSYIQVDTETRNVVYQIMSIICHQGTKSCGHYVAYIRNQEQWWLYDDSEVTRVANISGKVSGKDVAMCFYVPTSHDSMPSDNILIGTNKATNVPYTRNQRLITQGAGSSNKRPRLL